MCRGGCPYAALTASQVLHVSGSRDPICEAYRRMFDAVTERAMVEVFSSENLRAAVERPDRSLGLLQRGRLLSLMTAGGGRP
jgi:sulfatase maturation enzyme AslB (radical SAM superfamily)